MAKLCIQVEFKLTKKALEATLPTVKANIQKTYQKMGIPKDNTKVWVEE